MPELSNCTWCGKRFTANRKDGLFCSAACKQAYWRWKHRLNYLYAVASNAIEEINAYLEYENKTKEAENVLGALSDKLCLLGFVPSETQLELPAEAYTIENETGGGNE